MSKPSTPDPNEVWRSHLLRGSSYRRRILNKARLDHGRKPAAAGLENGPTGSIMLGASRNVAVPDSALSLVTSWKLKPKPPRTAGPSLACPKGAAAAPRLREMPERRLQDQPHAKSRFWDSWAESRRWSWPKSSCDDFL